MGKDLYPAHISGRYTSCNTEVTEQVYINIVLGLTILDACTLAGISQASFFNWRNRGKAELARIKGKGKDGTDLPVHGKEKVFIEFLEATLKAQTKFKQNSLLRIQQAARGGTKVESNVTVTKTYKDGTTSVTEEIRTSTAKPSWTADAWLLERKFKGEFSRNVNIQATIEDKLTPLLPEGVSSEDFLKQLREHLTKQPVLLEDGSSSSSDIIDGELASENVDDVV